MRGPPADATWTGTDGTLRDSFAFATFRLIPAERLLLDDGRRVVIGTRAFDLLVALVDRAGEVVGKDELLARVWPGLTVEEGNLRVHINGLRKALGDGQDGRRFVVNTPGRGYSFVGPVSRTPSGPAPPEKARAPGGNLPRPIPRMIGRDRLVELAAAQFPQRRFVTVVGAGGIGKTTFALAVADALRGSYRDGTYFVDLAPVAQPALVPTVLSAALGLPVGLGAPIPSLLSVLHDKEMLLVLDNCEHVVDGAATLAHELFRNAPGIHILATSRQPLRVMGEHVHRLPSLDLPPFAPRITAAHALTFGAVLLFAERAAALLDTFELTDANAPAVALICRRLDGIALAIEFAAARVDTLGVSGVADRLDDRFRLLGRGLRAAPQRHQTLRATFDWSHELLPEGARTVLRRLAVFAGQFTLASAYAVAGGEHVGGQEAHGQEAHGQEAHGQEAQGPDVHGHDTWGRTMDKVDVADELATLVSASLLVADPSVEPVTYRLLESTRAYALEQLVASAEHAPIRRRHADHFLRLLGQAGIASSNWPNAMWVRVHGHQLDNLRVALDWAFSREGDPGLGIELTVVGAPLWQRLSLMEECRSRAEAALARLPADGGDRRPRQEMQLLGALGTALALRSDMESRAAWAGALAIAERIGDRHYQLAALRGLWGNAFSTGDLPAAQDFAGRFAGLAAALPGAPALRPASDHMAGMNFFYMGELEAARLRIGQSLSAYEAVSRSGVLQFPVEHGLVVTSVNLSHMLWLRGRVEQAGRMVERSMELASSSAHGAMLSFALAYAACRISVETGQFAEARQRLARLAEQISWDPLAQWSVIHRCWTGVLQARQGDPAAAADTLAGALADIPEGNFRLHHTRFLGEWAHALGQAGRTTEALDAIERAIAAAERLGERWFFPELLRFRGEIVLQAGTPGAATVAAQQFRSALDWAGRLGALSWELRAATSFARFERAQGRAGEAWTILDQVYGKFETGFTTGDLQAARALLDDPV